jgi:hypothetical protein
VAYTSHSRQVLLQVERPEVEVGRLWRSGLCGWAGRPRVHVGMFSLSGRCLSVTCPGIEIWVWICGSGPEWHIGELPGRKDVKGHETEASIDRGERPRPHHEKRLGEGRNQHKRLGRGAMRLEELRSSKGTGVIRPGVDPWGQPCRGRESRGGTEMGRRCWRLRVQMTVQSRSRADLLLHTVGLGGETDPCPLAL